VTRPLDVLVVAPHAVHGGQEEWLLQMLASTDRLAPRVLLLQDGELARVLAARGIPCEVLPVGNRPLDLPLPVARLAARLRAAPPDVVVANGVKAQFVAGPAARLAGVPQVFVRHDHSFESLVGVLARFADRVVGTTEEVLEAVGRPDAVVVHPPRPPGVLLDRPAARARLVALGLPDDDARPVLGMCTRLVAYKGVDDAIAALTRSEGASWRLVVLGGDDPAEPQERVRLRQLAAQQGVADRVHLLGHVPRVSELLRGLDALAVLTKTGGPRDPGREGFGMAALEAMTAGVPVIGVGGGAVERRIAGQGGVVVPMADPQAVAAALHLLADPVERARRGAAAAALVRDHPTAEAGARRFAGVLAGAARRPGAGLEAAEPVSVVVPVYDEGEGVDEVVAALQRQLRPGDALVVVDDASRDDTAARLARLSADLPELTVVPMARNGGAAAARNAGVAGTAGEWVVCTDAGVHLPDGWLEALRTALADDPRVDLVTGGWVVSTRSPWERAMAAALHPDVEAARRPGPLVLLHRALFGRAFYADRPAGRSMAFRRSAWERVGGFPEHLRAGEDVAFGLAVAREGRSVLQLDAPVTWQQHADLSSTARMYFRYGRGDGLTGERLVVVRGTVRASAALVVPAALALGGPHMRAVVLALAGAYVSLPVWQLRAAPQPLRTAALVPAVLGVKDLAKAAGCLVGLWQARTSRRTS